MFNIHNVLVTRFERVSDVCLAYVEFCNLFNAPGARFNYTLMCDCCLTYTGVPQTHQTRSERIQRACNVRETYLGHISHTPETRRASRNL